MTINIKNIHPTLSIKTEKRHCKKSYNDHIQHWRDTLHKTINRDGSQDFINDDYDVVCIYEGEKLIHTHYLMYTKNSIRAVYSDFELMSEDSFYSTIALSDADQPKKDKTLNIKAEKQQSGKFDITFLSKNAESHKVV